MRTAIVIIVSLGGLLFRGATAYATNTTNNLTVTMQITASCTIGVATLAFGAGTRAIVLPVTDEPFDLGPVMLPPVQLVGAGVLNASHGRGWYVAKSASRREWPNTLESFSETAARMGLEPQSEVLRAEAAHEPGAGHGFSNASWGYILAHARRSRSIATGANSASGKYRIAAGAASIGRTFSWPTCS